MEDAVPREITEETRSTGISQAILVDPMEDTEMDLSEGTIAEEIEMTDTIDVTEVGIPEPTLEATSSKESTTTPPGSPQRKNPKSKTTEKTILKRIQNKQSKRHTNTPKQIIPLLTKSFQFSDKQRNPSTQFPCN